MRRRPHGCSPDDYPDRLRSGRLEAELCGDYYLVAHRGEGFADELFIDKRAVDLCGVEERDTALEGGANQRDATGFVHGRAVAIAEPHAVDASAETSRLLFPSFRICMASLHFGYTR